MIVDGEAVAFNEDDWGEEAAPPEKRAAGTQTDPVRVSMTKYQRGLARLTLLIRRSVLREATGGSNVENFRIRFGTGAKNGRLLLICDPQGPFQAVQVGVYAEGFDELRKTMRISIAPDEERFPDCPVAPVGCAHSVTKPVGQVPGTIEVDLPTWAYLDSARRAVNRAARGDAASLEKSDT